MANVFVGQHRMGLFISFQAPWLPEMLGRKQMVTDEACLFLNVWTTNLSAG